SSATSPRSVIGPRCGSCEPTSTIRPSATATYPPAIGGPSIGSTQRARSAYWLIALRSQHGRVAALASLFELFLSGERVSHAMQAPQDRDGHDAANCHRRPAIKERRFAPQQERQRRIGIGRYRLGQLVSRELQRVV